MATPQLITRDNFGPLLKRSTEGRSGSPDGNFFIDTDNDLIELITLEELAQIDLGSGLEANPLTNATKIQGLAIYFALLVEAQNDPALQNFLSAMDAAPNRLGRLTGAMSFLNGVKLATSGSLGDDRFKLADTGATEFAVGSGGNTLIDRIYHGTQSLNVIDDNSQPFFMIADSLSEADRQAAAPVDFSKTGAVDEMIQSFGSTANGDSGAGNFDSRNSVLILGVRTFGFTVGEVDSLATGVSELGAYSQGYGLGEQVVNDIAALDPADVFGPSAIAPYTGISFERVATPEVKTGFSQPDGSFTDIIRNTEGASLLQLRAWLDLFMQQDSNQNALSGTTGDFFPKRAEPFYTIDAGRLVTRQGVFLEAVPTADQQAIALTANDGIQKTYPFNPSVIVRLSRTWFDDATPWFRMMFTDGAGGLDFQSDAAVTVSDADGSPVTGNQTDARIVPVNGGEFYELRFAFAYDSDTSAGLAAGVDKEFTFSCGGTATSKRRTVNGLFERVTTISVDASTDAETN